ncbi:hypothetical protein ACVXHB_15770 [Escherichia coli]
MRMASALYVQYVKSTGRRRFPRCRCRSLEELMARAGKRDAGILVGGKPSVLAQTKLNCATSGM